MKRSPVVRWLFIRSDDLARCCLFGAAKFKIGVELIGLKEKTPRREQNASVAKYQIINGVLFNYKNGRNEQCNDRK